MHRPLEGKGIPGEVVGKVVWQMKKLPKANNIVPRAIYTIGYSLTFMQGAR